MPPKLKRRRKPNLGHKPQRAPQAIGPANLTGFADLPPELLLEIVDHLPRFPVPCNYLESPLKSEIPTRQATLLVLIQLCRSFRQTLIPYVWEEIVLCSVRAGQMHPVDYRWRPHTCRVKQKGYCDSCEKPLAYDIMAQLATVRFRDPEYATRVQTLSIFIPRYSWKTILPEFAECLSILPNLKTLQLHFTHYWYAPLFGQATQKVFFKYQYTSIQTVVVPGVPGSMALIAVCPNLCHLHFTSPGDFWQPSPSIEKITGVLVDHFYDCLPRILPNLKYVQWRTKGHQGTYPFEVMAQLPKLEVVEIVLTQPEFKEEAEYMQACAQAVLDSMIDIPGTHRRVEMSDCTA